MATSTDRLGPIDYLIVGGGSAGCVMASRLSEDPDVRVVLLESGPVFTPAEEPPGIGDLSTRASLNPGLMWAGLTAVANPDPAHPEGGIGVPYGQAQVLGGGSSVNGMHAHRGLPGDYDEWSGFGVAGWAWQDVLPFFRKLESDRDFVGPLHGDSGPITVRRWSEEASSPFERAIADDWRARQAPVLDDLNGAGTVGGFPVPLSIKDGRRMSAARGYLDERVQARPNLTILGGIKVERLRIDGNVVLGVRAVSKNERLTIDAAHVVLSAGALASPSLLQRSGIGDAAALSGAGIQPLLHRPGVGANLQNHPTILLAAHLRKTARTRGMRPPCITGVRYSSGLPDCAEADMITTTMGMAPDATARNPLGRTLGALFSLIQKSYSRGSVKPSPDGNPKIVFDTFADDRDLTRLVMGWETIRDQLTKGPAADHVNDVFVPMSFGRSDDSLTTAIVNRLAAGLLDSNAAVRRRIIAKIGIPVVAVPAGGQALRDWVRQCGFPAYHAAGSCRMGRVDDEQAVVDSGCRVIGVRGLSVVDASIFPTLMRSGTNIPSIMAAEKASAMMRDEKRHRMMN